MKYFVVSQKIKGEKAPLAAFTTHEKLEAYLASKELTDTKSETFEGQLGDEEKIDILYVGFLKRDERKIFYGYFTQKFDALNAVRGKGFLGTIPIDPPSTPKEDESTPAASEKETESAPKKEKASFENSPKAAPRKRKKGEIVDNSDSKLKILVFLGVLWVGTAFGISKFFSETAEFAENQTSVPWLPESCHDISYYISKRIQSYEFTTTKAGFLEFVNAEGLTHKEIPEGESVQISSYRHYADIPMPDELKFLPEDQQWKRWNQIASPTILKGYMLTGFKDDAVTEVKGAFDSLSGRTYFWSKKTIKE